MTTMEQPQQEEAVRKKHNVTADDLYRRSSQYKLWSYTPEVLHEIRQNANEQGQLAATNRFRTAYEEIRQQNVELFEKHSDDLEETKLLSLISLEEELKYLNFYSRNIIQAANFFKMPTQVKATAASFFKKFYLQYSVMQYHPKNILYTCLFLAAKSENYFISIDSFCKALQKTEPKDILDLEFIVLQSLKFTLLVHHPFRPLYGFFLDFQEALLIPEPKIPGLTIDRLGETYDKAKKWLNDYTLLSDVAFHFTPPQVALTAMYDIDNSIVEQYLKIKFLDDRLETVQEKDESEEQESEGSSQEKQTSSHYHLILHAIKECTRIAKAQPTTSKEESTAIDRKCYFAIHPDKLISKRVKKLSQSNGSATA